MVNYGSLKRNFGLTNFQLFFPGKEGVVSVFPSQKKQLHTSRSWEFMGFNKKMKTSIIESDIIIGMLDTGVWPESESFNDTELGPIPSKWKGTCQQSANFTCNKYIIKLKIMEIVH